MAVSDVLDKHAKEVKQMETQKKRLIGARTQAIEATKKAIDLLNKEEDPDKGPSPDQVTKRSELLVHQAQMINELEQLQHEIDNSPEPDLQGEEKPEYYGKWKAHSSRQSKLELHRGQAFSLILGQCTQVL